MPELVIATGDIVGSSRLTAEDLDSAMAWLAQASKLIWNWKNRSQPPDFVRFRGDGWQAALPEPALGLRAALFLRAGMRRLGSRMDTRISLGIGPGAFAPAGGLEAATGPAFEISGRGLDEMNRSARFAIGWSDPGPDHAAIRAVFALSDEISRRWTARQAAVFCLGLAPDAGPQRSMAEHLGISQQMVAKHLGAGGDWALRQAMQVQERSQ
jgi:hypothetical protein